MLIGGEDQLAAAEREIEVQRRLRHPNLMPLLEASVGEEAAPDGVRQAALMLFPLYEVGAPQMAGRRRAGGKGWLSCWRGACTELGG